MGDAEVQLDCTGFPGQALSAPVCGRVLSPLRPKVSFASNSQARNNADLTAGQFPAHIITSTSNSKHQTAPEMRPFESKQGRGRRRNRKSGGTDSYRDSVANPFGELSPPPTPPRQ